MSAIYKNRFIEHRIININKAITFSFFDFENDIICAKLAEKLQTAYEGLKKKSKVTLVEPEQLETPKGDEQAAKTGDNMIIGTWLITMSAAVMVVIFLNKRRSLEK